MIPHVTDAIKEFIRDGNDGFDFVLCEIGGTVGDIEGLPFFEAIRQLGNDLPRDHAIYIHLTLLPYIPSAGELKTKPTQHSVKELRSIGIQPDILLCRCDRPIPEEERRKLGLFCNVRRSAVIQALDVDNIYAVPEAYHAAGLDREVLAAFGIEPKAEPDLSRWRTINERIRNPEGEVTIADRRQVHRPEGRLQIADRGAVARRHRQQGRRSSSTGSSARCSSAKTRRRSSSTSTASWCPAASASAAPRARSRRRSSRASIACRISASASACRWR